MCRVKQKVYRDHNDVDLEGIDPILMTYGGAIKVN